MTTHDPASQALADRKAAAREAGFIRRRAIARAERETTANRHLFDYVMSTGVGTVSAFMAIRTEINPMATMERLVAAGVRVCVPVIIGPREPLIFHEWMPETLMKRGAYGAAIPERSPALTPDLVITPLIAFDAAGNRLGYGGGYYDRTLGGLREHARVRAVGLAYAGQEVESVPVDDTDIGLDAIVTEDGVRTF